MLVRIRIWDCKLKLQIFKYIPLRNKYISSKAVSLILLRRLYKKGDFEVANSSCQFLLELWPIPQNCALFVMGCVDSWRIATPSRWWWSDSQPWTVASVGQSSPESVARYLQGIGMESPLKHVYSSCRITHLQVILEDSVFPSDVPRVVFEDPCENPLVNMIVKMWNSPCPKIPQVKASCANKKSWFSYIKKVDRVHRSEWLRHETLLIIIVT